MSRATRQVRRAGAHSSLMAKGSIADIRWDNPADREWLRRSVSAAFRRDLPEFVEAMGPEFSVYRCVACGAYGAIEGIGSEVLTLWSVKGRRCNPCMGCDCESCRQERERAPA